ncbi:hypothetical protein [Pleomorphomonas oryzae]|nr:hypothetical protein [Pleomorphomonas oryzae]
MFDELTQNPATVTMKFIVLGKDPANFLDVTARPDRGDIAAERMKLL